MLAIGVRTDLEFARLFTAGRATPTTETYAFGEDGTLLTPTRSIDELIAAGHAVERNGTGGVFTVPVRDPGGDLLDGHLSLTEAAARPLTQAAALAVAARGKPAEAEQRGTLEEPYRNYAGREVIGAWRWLSDYQIGVVAERSTVEAFAALRYLRVSFAVIGGFVLLSLLAALTSGVSLARLRRQFGQLQKLGAYTLERQLSEGGMATIYLARHALLKRRTAIKILKKSIGSDEFAHRFEREVQLVSQLRHPNTVQIYDFGRTSDGQPYYVMEYIEGVTLAQLVDHSGPVPPGRVIHILRQIAAALREAHSHGLVHRDVKPDNVMLCRRGEDDFVKLLDFGLVKDVLREETRDVTKQIRILGTPRYMSPERIVNPSDVDARADLYALGAVGYFLLTGRNTFEGEDSQDIANQVLHAPAPRVSADRSERARGARRADRRVPREGPVEAAAVGRSGGRGARPAFHPARVDAAGRRGLVDRVSRGEGGRTDAKLAGGRPATARRVSREVLTRDGRSRGSVGPLPGAGALQDRDHLAIAASTGEGERRVRRAGRRG